ncbi:MAG: Si-specific NAD(P)(+) transhydrogenase [Actinobacteria bacterium]|nr:Si-specific NAD(P)(+) transhydrogenase [Actinomycetota bacterium]
MSDFDLVVIGSGPAGQKAAVQAAKLRYRVAVVECRDRPGGVCMNTGTIPSKTLREAALYLTGFSQRSLYGQSYRVKDDLTIDDLLLRTQHVIDRETEVVRDQLTRNHVTILTGEGSFVDANTIKVSSEGSERVVSADHVVLATGTTPARPSTVEFDDKTIIDSDGILALERIPSTLCVVGAGVIGIEYAAIFASLGSKVTVVEQRDQLLDFCDRQIVEGLQYHLRDLNVTFRLRETVTAVERFEDQSVTRLESGKAILSDVVLYSAGRQGATATLALENAGLEADKRGRIEVDEHYRTAVPHIYAVGDVIGFPALAATSMEQGRLAACHAFGVETDPTAREIMPIGIYTVPEISFVGKTEEELTDAAVPYEVGISKYHELARGQILGETHGLLKLLVHSETRNLLGVHAFGSGATELVHIGQAVMALGGTVDYLVNSVFNYPTLAESYKVAALDATNKLRALSTVVGSRPAA